MIHDSDSDASDIQLVSLACEIAVEYTGKRLDKVAVHIWPDFSRTQISGWIKSGELTVDESSVVPSYKVMGGQRIQIKATLGAEQDWHQPQVVPFGIVFEDEHLLVIDKPAGVVVHPGAGNHDKTLVNGLLKFDDQLAGLPRAGLIHRLDKDTSGLLLVARTNKCFKLLTIALKKREIQRRYHALVEGVLTGGMTIDVPLARDPHNRTRQKVRESGRIAITHVKVLERFRAHTLVEAKLETGRTHQIRVHMSHIGFPLLGDTRYGARLRLPKQPHPDLVNGIKSFKRQALHAKSLRFSHPVTDEWIECDSCRPVDLKLLLDLLHQDMNSHVG
ncbi:MAG: RluA family pseudouridine synthase [Pseudomonadales bacterium]|nr:RluA family pseudouridine synthase [Pseudomonadales bacterium]